MVASNQQASLAELANWLRLEESPMGDRLEMASAWQRLPANSSDKMVTILGAAMALLIIALLVIQAMATHSSLTLAIALVGLLLVIVVGWRLRGWFWRTVVKVDDGRLLMSFLGWGVPRSIDVPLDNISSLIYYLDNGQLYGLTLVHTQGRLALPFSGRRELDKLYCNLLKLLLQRRRPSIGFENGSETS